MFKQNNVVTLELNHTDAGLLTRQQLIDMFNVLHAVRRDKGLAWPDDYHKRLLNATVGLTSVDAILEAVEIEIIKMETNLIDLFGGQG